MSKKIHSRQKPLITLSPETSKKALWMFWLIFTGVVFYSAYDTSQFLKGAKVYPALITESDHHCKKPWRNAALTMMEGKKVDVCFQKSWFHETFTGTEIELWYNPAHSTRARLNNYFSMYAFTLFGGLFSAAMGYMLLIGRNKRHKTY